MLPWQRHIRQLHDQKTKVRVVNWLVVIFDDREIKGFREKVNETQASITVFSHLKSLFTYPVFRGKKIKNPARVENYIFSPES